MQSKTDIDVAPVGPRTVAQKGKKPVTSERQDLPHISIADIRPQDVRVFLRIQPDGNFSARWQLTAQDKVQGPEYLGRYSYLLRDTARRPTSGLTLV
jgi:hypothetical protein